MWIIYILYIFIELETLTIFISVKTIKRGAHVNYAAFYQIGEYYTHDVNRFCV